MAAIAVVGPRRRLGPGAIRRSTLLTALNWSKGRIAPKILQTAILNAGKRLAKGPQETEGSVQMRKDVKSRRNELKVLLERKKLAFFWANKNSKRT
jgi:hypothetical protein